MVGHRRSPPRVRGMIVTITRRNGQRLRFWVARRTRSVVQAAVKQALMDAHSLNEQAVDEYIAAAHYEVAAWHMPAIVATQDLPALAQGITRRKE